MTTTALMDGFVIQDDIRGQCSPTSASSTDDPEKLKKRAMIRFTAELARKLEESAQNLSDLPEQAEGFLSRETIASTQNSAKNLSTALEMPDAFEVGEQDSLANKITTKLVVCLQDLFFVPKADDAAVHECSTEDSVEQEIESYEELKKNWDGHGAARISSFSIKYTLAFLRENPDLAKIAEPFPDPNGNVGLEARTGNKVLYLSFAPSGEIAYLVRKGKVVDRGRGADNTKIRNVLQAIF